ncbi:hypothetical protein HDV00_010437 [Rhizophlyctis rosea]|nr:hypothetical protein HDV00_010437 [Rhizophlyctis rosea]
MAVENGLLVAYAALLTMAVVPIYFGSMAALRLPPKTKKGKKVEEEEEKEFFSFDDAKMFPILGSATLFSLYLVFKFLDKQYINYLVTAYFSILGVGALVETTLGISRRLTGWDLKGEYRIDMWKLDKEILSYHFGTYHLVLLFISTIVGALYALTKHWIISNVYGEAFAASAVQLLNLDSFKTGMALLAGLFLYDIFWVFGTDVMVTVAKSFEAPVKVVWPKDIWQLVESGLFKSTEGVQFTMLGLGDIVIPGIFVALCLQFDHHRYLTSAAGKKNKHTYSFPKPYFHACFVAYILGLVTTVVVMHTFQAAQPALLYLSPACIFSALITAAARGEIKELFAFSPAESSKKDKNDKKEKKKKGGVKSEDDSGDEQGAGSGSTTSDELFKSDESARSSRAGSAEDLAVVKQEEEESGNGAKGGLKKRRGKKR